MFNWHQQNDRGWWERFRGIRIRPETTGSQERSQASAHKWTTAGSHTAMTGNCHPSRFCSTTPRRGLVWCKNFDHSNLQWVLVKFHPDRLRSEIELLKKFQAVVIASSGYPLLLGGRSYGFCCRFSVQKNFFVTVLWLLFLSRLFAPSFRNADSRNFLYDSKILTE